MLFLIFQCNLCQKTFRGIDIDIHQREYCSARKQLQTSQSTVAQLREARLPEKTAGQRRHFENSAANNVLLDESSSPKMPKLTFLPQQQQQQQQQHQQQQHQQPSRLLHNGGGIVTFSKAPSPQTYPGGLLQIAKLGHQSGGSSSTTTLSQSMSKAPLDLKSLIASTSFNIPGIPTPSMCGVLTGIKSASALFSLPGKRLDIHAAKPDVASNDPTSTVPHVPGMPGPSGKQGSTLSPWMSKTSPVKEEIKIEVAESKDDQGRFLRPNSLPLTPGSFKTKKHVMLTSGATLVSPETPRPRKSYMLQYQNGTAYTTLGLKCSTRVYYTTIFQQQPMYVANNPRISMYSNWRVVTKVISTLFP
jgi:hypothetical protein